MRGNLTARAVKRFQISTIPNRSLTFRDLRRTHNGRRRIRRVREIRRWEYQRASQMYYREIGAYADLVPDDSLRGDTFTPSKPPPIRPR